MAKTSRNASRSWAPANNRPASESSKRHQQAAQQLGKDFGSKYPKSLDPNGSYESQARDIPVPGNGKQQ